MEAVAWDLACAFARHGAAVTVLTTPVDSLPRHGVVNGIQIHCVDAPEGRYSREWWRLTSRLVTKYDSVTDVVLSVSAGARSMLQARREGGPPYVIQAHGTAWGELVSKIRQRSPRAAVAALKDVVALFKDQAYRRADAIVAVGDQVAKDMARSPTRRIIGEVTVHTIANGIDPGSFEFDSALRAGMREREQIPADARVALCASRLHSQKGVREAVEGFLLAANDDPLLYLIVAGSGPEEEWLQTRVAQSPHQDRIRFVGNVPRAELRGWLSAADVFLFTTKRVEGLPLNILEARAAGLPVIASRALKDERLGVVPVNPEDAASIGKALNRVLASASSDRASLLPKLFSLDHSAREYLDLFESLRRQRG